eukprot:scaffold24048_cov194-Amphora_coffeaeformis.AAC.10
MMIKRDVTPSATCTLLSSLAHIKEEKEIRLQYHTMPVTIASASARGINLTSPRDNAMFYFRSVG